MGIFLPDAVSSVNGQTGAVELTLAGSFTDVLGILNGGTGSATQNFVDLSSTQTSIGGQKTFTGGNVLSTAGFWGNTGFKFGANAASGTDPLSGYISGINAYTNGVVFGIKANASQTNDLTRWLSSAGATLTAIDKSGNIYFGSNNTISIGSSSAYASNIYTTVVNLNSTASISGSTAGQLLLTGDSTNTTGAVFIAPPTNTSITNGPIALNISNTYAPSTATGARGWAMKFGTTANGSSNLTGTPMALTGIEGNAQYTGTASSVSSIGGSLFYAQSSAGSGTTVGWLYGVYIYHMRNTGAGTVSNTAGLYVSSNSNTGGGTLTTSYGLYVESQSAAASNYAIYTNGGLVRFGDQVRFTASTTAAASLNIPSGVAPTSPNSGDVYYDGTSLQFYNGTNKIALDHPSDWNASDSALIAWAYDPTGNTASTVALGTAGTLYVIKLHVGAPTSITNIVMDVNAAGASLTTGQCFAALYNASTGALVGTTADQSTAWTTTGIKTMALSGGPFSVSEGYYYVAVWFNGTTGPAFSRTQGTSIINVGLAATASRWGTANTSITTTAPSTLGTIAAASNSYWAAVS